jgi:hypothetical protein
LGDVIAPDVQAVVLGGLHFSLLLPPEVGGLE